MYIGEQDNQPKAPIDLLVIDDDVDTGKIIQAFIRRQGLSAMIAHNGFVGVHAARRHQPRVVLLDINMPGMDGLKAAEMIRNYAPSSKVVLISGYEKALSEAGRSDTQAFAVLEKPVPLAAIADFVKRASIHETAQ